LLRYGKKLDRCYDDKLARSNRGRARTSAATEGRKHANRGYRRGQAQIAEIRADKKRARLVAQLAAADELFDLDLAKFDPEIWLHGTDLTTFKDTVTKPHCGYPSSCFTVNPYAYVPDAFDWNWEGSSYQDQDDEDDFCYLHAGDYDSRDYMSDWDEGSDPDPEPIEAAWRDLWVNGHAHDPEGRDLPDPMYDRWYDGYYDTYDYLADLDNPLLEREDPALPATAEAAAERNIERHRAGERYFRQTGRTVLVPLGRHAS
jgi:hypothetical protein